MPAAPRTTPKAPRALSLALCVVGLIWVLAARAGAESAAQGIARLLRASVLRPFLYQVFALILLLTGFTALNWLARRVGSVRQTNALPTRPTTVREWRLGAALGWALLLAVVLPMVLVGDLHPVFWTAPRAWLLAGLSLLTLLVGALATEVAFRGFVYRNLIQAFGPTSATVVLAGIYALISTSLLNTTPFSFLVMLLSGILFSVAYLRTHALWLGWGMHFAWLASMGVLFGLPLAGSPDLSTVVSTDSSGQLWLTGGAYGPQGAITTAFLLVGAMFATYKLTREFAWQYTHTPIVAGGYPMEVPPPAAHEAFAREERPAPLVQIHMPGGSGEAAPPPVRPETMEPRTETGSNHP